MKLLLLALLLAACASSNTVNVRGTGEADSRAEIRIENNNWNEARIYLLPGSNLAGRQRIATVSGGSQETRRIRLISPTFRFYITLLADSGRWVSEEWTDQHWKCFSIVIHNYLAFTYVIPCPGKRE